MALDTLTLKNSTGATTAVMRYPTDDTAYPIYEKNFTKERLANGDYVYDYPLNQEKRTWDMMIIREDAGDNLITNLKTLFDLKEELLLDENALIIENNIPVVFELFQPIFRGVNMYDYHVVLQEV
jgi:hypothetical protein